MEERLTPTTGTVAGVFDDTYQAEQAMAELSEIGFREDQIDFMMSEASTVMGSYTAGGEPVLRSHEAGRAVIRVRSDGRDREIEEVFHRYGASDVSATDRIDTGNTGEIAKRETLEGESWDEVRPGYRFRWQRQYGAAGRRWEDYEPAYRYGWEQARAEENRGRSWAQVEPEFKSNWEQRHHVSPWERIVDAVRDAWENVTGQHDRMDRAA